MPLSDACKRWSAALMPLWWPWRLPCPRTLPVRLPDPLRPSPGHHPRLQACLMAG